VDEFAAAVLAGGRSTRLGRSKPTAPLGGRPLIEYPLGALREAGFETVVVAKRETELPPLDVAVWLEPDEPSHPLLGVTTALARAGRPLLVCGCDLPFVTAALARRLAETPRQSARERIVVPSTGSRLHPLFGRYDPAFLDELSVALAACRSMREAITALDPLLLEAEELARFGDPARLLFNVNTPEDLSRAEQLLGGGSYS
jgi:molybdopterin-guanine dinucleotide biosynthesis protein A